VVSGARIEGSTSRMQVWSVIAKRACSDPELCFSNLTFLGGVVFLAPLKLQRSAVASILNGFRIFQVQKYPATLIR
jgi:hypothetical protein